MVPRQEEADGQQRQHEMLAESQPVEQPGQKRVGPVPHAQQEHAQLIADQQRREKHQAGQRPPRLDPISLGHTGPRVTTGR